MSAPRRSASPARLIALFVVLTLLFLLMAGRLFVLQIVESPAFASRAEQQRERVVEFPARRGAIFDRSGRTLAVSVDMQTVFADPSLVEDPDAEAAKLARVLRMDAAELALGLRGSHPGSRFEYVARMVEPEVARRVRALELAGIYLKPEAKRVYPNGRVGSHLLGFVNIDGTVKEGIEAQYDDILQGKPGRMVLEQDPHGRPLPQAEFSYDKPRAGESLMLTIDKDLQYFTELTLQDAISRYHATSGTAIVTKPATGEILALANLPNFDPNHYNESAPDARRNRALTDVYEPGSVFKAVTLSAALAERVVTPTSTFVVPDELQVADRVIHDSHWHNTERMSVRHIIVQSSNVGTVMVGQKLGGEQLDRYVHRFGFGSGTGLDFPGESPGIVRPLEEWSGSSIANIPIGQGIAVTPMQMLQAYSTLANGGVWVEPKLLYGRIDSEGRPLESTEPARKRVIPATVAHRVTDILRGVVNEGTGTEAAIPGYEVAGKTGTAQKVLATGGYGDDDHMATFAGYAPAKRPAVAAIVVLDNPSPIWGGATAAPTFRIIVEQALRELGVAPTRNAERAAQELESEGPPDEPAHD